MGNRTSYLLEINSGFSMLGYGSNVLPPLLQNLQTEKKTIFEKVNGDFVATLAHFTGPSVAS